MQALRHISSLVGQGYDREAGHGPEGAGDQGHGAEGLLRHGAREERARPQDRYSGGREVLRAVYAWCWQFCFLNQYSFLLL